MTSERWAGFTDEDIERIKSNPKLTKSCANNLCEIDGSKSSMSQVRRPMKIKNASLRPVRNDNLDDGYESNSACFENKKQVSTYGKNLTDEQNSDQNLSLLYHENFVLKDEKECVCNNIIYESNGIDIQRPGIILQAGDSEEINSEISHEDTQSNTSLPALEVFEMRQKRIEAENARRRALINKAITDKKMQTQAEAIKLAKITQELSRIDSHFSADVSILRDYIEKASLEFTEAEKRYRKAEREYVDAKYILFQKMQRKEMLTEHLCAIIEQNENKKADKLVELMKQLEMEVIVEDVEVKGAQSILPNLCTLNEELYRSCHTLKPSLVKSESQEQLSSPEQTQNTEQKQISCIEESQRTAEVVCALLMNDTGLSATLAGN